jgi:Domain of unknown function (DUF4105)
MMSFFRNSCIFLLIFAFKSAFAHPFSQNAQVSLLTCSSGEELYSLFGHSAIRVQDTTLHSDIVYNYGTFDFHTDNFYVKFTRGKLNYCLSLEEFRDMEAAYTQEGRGMVEQVLNLSPNEKDQLLDLLEDNYLPQNRFYKYDFFYDNCSTRIRDIIQRAVRTNYIATPHTNKKETFRQMLHNCVDKPMPWVGFGFDLILGMNTEKIATPQERTFLPYELMYSLDAAKRTDFMQTMVGVHNTLITAHPSTAPPTPISPNQACWCIFIIFAAITFFNFTRNAYFDGLDRLLFFVVGLMGCIFIFMWTATDHHTTYKNLNMLWAIPTHLLAAFLFRRKGMRVYWVGTVVVMLVFLASWQFLPQNFHTAIVPLVLTLAMRAAALCVSRR